LHLQITNDAVNISITFKLELEAVTEQTDKQIDLPQYINRSSCGTVHHTIRKPSLECKPALQPKMSLLSKTINQHLHY